MSFIEVPKDHDFSYHNLPYGIFSTYSNTKRRPGVAIGNYVLDLMAVKDYFTGPLMSKVAGEVFSRDVLNDFMALSPEHWAETREYLKSLLSKDNPFLRDDKELRQTALHPIRDVEMHLPARIGDYTDFYASIDHAMNIGNMMRGPGNELMPNYRWLPVGYHGRASSVMISGTPVARPSGQTCPPNATAPVFGASKALDFELEMGCFIGGKTNILGQPIRMSDAERNLFGLVILNDWSARDIQRWEYQPLGPFLAKNFATTISPWVVTFEALKEFKTENHEQDPKPLPYLHHNEPFNFDIELEVKYKPRQLSESKTICKSNFKYLYWTLKQMLAHHTVTGCNLNPGDLFGTGTISGPEEGTYGSMMELSWKGTKPILFEGNITRTYIEDGDEVIMSAYCEGSGYRVGFGDCSGLVLPSKLLQSRPSIVISQSN